MISRDRWSLDHDGERRTLAVLADGIVTVERVLKWSVRTNPGVMLIGESMTVHGIGRFRRRSGARGNGGVEVACGYRLLS